MLEKLERKDKRRGAKGTNNLRICLTLLLNLSQNMQLNNFAKATESAFQKEVMPTHSSVFR